MIHWPRAAKQSEDSLRDQRDAISESPTTDGLSGESGLAGTYRVCIERIRLDTVRVTRG